VAVNHELAENRGQQLVGSKTRMETNGRTDMTDRITLLASTVGKQWCRSTCVLFLAASCYQLSSALPPQQPVCHAYWARILTAPDVGLSVASSTFAVSNRLCLRRRCAHTTKPGACVLAYRMPCCGIFFVPLKFIALLTREDKEQRNIIGYIQSGPKKWGHILMAIILSNL